MRVDKKNDMPSVISVIIPTLNEARLLKETIENLRDAEAIEVIVVDGGSKDDTLSIAGDLADQVFSSAPSRGGQMDIGAEKATGEILLFLHADTHLPMGWESKIRSAIKSGKTGGAFNLSVSSPDKYLWLVALMANFRSKILGITYGDQAIFAEKEAFFNAGGFKRLALFEDIDLWRRLKKGGPLVILRDAVCTSHRKWKSEGSIKNTLKNWSLIILYYFGFSPKMLYNFYYNKGG